MTTPTREIHLARRPTGPPDAETFAFVDRLLPAPADGQVVVRNLALSIDPYMRPRMNDEPSYVKPYEVGKALLGGAVGEVIASANSSIPRGTKVLHSSGWREHALLSGDQVKVIADGPFPLSYHLGVLGMPGFTAYLGLMHIAEFRPGDIVFVSAAGGAVGGLVGQFARLSDAGKVIGSAGSEEKAAYVLKDLGFHAAINYRSEEPLLTQLRRASPEGVDVYFDNVGGEHLSATLEVMRDHGRIALCGTISSYNGSSGTTVPGNMFKAVAKRLTLKGFLTLDHEPVRPAFEAAVADWLASGQLHYRETSTSGLDSMPAAFAGMLQGSNTGKAIVTLPG
jgi:NADPH-dependent curcumin reductase CurA